MNIEELFSQRKKRYAALTKKRREAAEPEVTICTCPFCKAQIRQEILKEALYICPECDKYLPVPTEERLELLCDSNSFKELFAEVRSKDPLAFPGYREKLENLESVHGQPDAFTAGTASVKGVRAAIGVLDGRFLMGSMGTAAGEKIVRLTEYATKKKLPLVIVSASGGARMQEGLFSLMQMAKTAAAVERFRSEEGLFISILTNPTTGGVSASYASLGDIILAEPDALICFAGPRVIEQTIGQKLPEGFQHAEFLLEHGMIDRIVERKKLRSTLGHLLRLHSRTQNG